MRERTLDPDALRARRKDAGLTQAKLAARAGVSVSYVKYLEAGSCQPSDPYAEAIATALDCDVDDFSTPKVAA